MQELAGNRREQKLLHTRRPRLHSSRHPKAFNPFRAGYATVHNTIATKFSLEADIIKRPRFKISKIPSKPQSPTAPPTRSLYRNAPKCSFLRSPLHILLIPYGERGTAIVRPTHRTITRCTLTAGRGRFHGIMDQVAEYSHARRGHCCLVHVGHDAQSASRELSSYAGGEDAGVADASKLL